MQPARGSSCSPTLHAQGTMTIQERHLIERYLRGDLSGFELEEFKKQLQEDDSFRRKIEKQESLYTAIDSAWRKMQQDRIIVELNYKKPLVPAALKLILVFLITLF